jgi:hypothetical protein
LGEDAQCVGARFSPGAETAASVAPVAPDGRIAASAQGSANP